MSEQSSFNEKTPEQRDEDRKKRWLPLAILIPVILCGGILVCGVVLFVSGGAGYLSYSQSGETTAPTSALEEAAGVTPTLAGAVQPTEPSVEYTCDPGAATDLTTALADGTLILVGVSSTASNHEISGPILSVEVQNPGSSEVAVTIPPGLVFEPASGDTEQRLMVIQRATAVIPAGASVALTPYVICIDGGREAPQNGSAYRVGDMAGGDLQVLAECVCGHNLSVELADPSAAPQMLGLQFAVWSASQGINLGAFLGSMGSIPMPTGMPSAGGGTGGAMTDLLSGSQDMGALLQQAGASSQEWLAECQVELP